MNENYEPPVKLDRKDFYDVLANLPKLPEGAIITEPHSVCNPIAIDTKTGVYYTLRNNQWVFADEDE